MPSVEIDAPPSGGEDADVAAETACVALSPSDKAPEAPRFVSLQNSRVEGDNAAVGRPSGVTVRCKGLSFAVMGRSGSGKSSLLNCLSARVSRGVCGEVLFDQVPAGKGAAARRLSAFVQQEDLFLAHLTVQEHLYFQVLLLEEGRLLFYGERSAAVSWFEELTGEPCHPDLNPAEYLLKITSPSNLSREERLKQTLQMSAAWTAKGEDFLRRWRKENALSPFVETPLLNVRTPSTTLVRLATTLITATIPSLVYFQLGWAVSDAWNRFAASYQVLISESLNALYAVIYVLPASRRVAQREFESGVIRVWAYFLAVRISDAALSLMFPFVFHLIAFWSVGMAQSAVKYFATLGILLLGILATQSYAYLISAAIDDSVVALAVTQVVQVFFAIFCGFFVKLDSIGAFWRALSALVPQKYTLALFALVLYEGEEYGGVEGDPISGEVFLKQTFGIRREYFYPYLACLCAVLVVPYLLAVGILELKARRRRENA